MDGRCIAIKEIELKGEGQNPEVKVKTRVFRAVPIKNEIEESMFMIATARRSSIEVSYTCANCGLQVKKQELETCAYCGERFCGSCWREHECEEEYDAD